MSKVEAVTLVYCKECRTVKAVYAYSIGNQIWCGACHATKEFVSLYAGENPVVYTAVED